MSSDIPGNRGSWFRAPATPPDAQRVRVTPGMTPARLGFSIIRSAGWYALAGSSLLILFNIANMLIPVALGRVVDVGIAPLTTGTAWTDALPGFLLWVGAIALLYVVTNCTYRFGGRLGWYGVQRAQYELSDRVLARILDSRGMSGASRLPGSLLAVATLDVHRACLALYVAIYPIGELVAVAVAAVSLFAIHPLLGIGVIVGAPVLLGLMWLVAGPLQRRSAIEQERIADATATAADLVTGLRVLTGIHAQRAATERYRRVSRTALEGTLAARTAEGAFQGVNTMLSGLFAAAVTIGAAVLAFNGQIGIGGLIAAGGIAQILLEPLRSLVGQAGSFWAIAMASAGRLLDLLAVPEREDSQGSAAPDTAPAVRLDALPMRGGILDARVEAGEFVALDVGAADASTLVAALSLRQDVADGAEPLARRIRLASTPLNTLDPDRLREIVLVAPHHADLFEASVLENVAGSLDRQAPADRGRPGGWSPDSSVGGSADSLRVRAALTVAHCQSLEHELPEGYETVVGEAGRTLSGGQRQRVALARAVAADPPVLVLHDPTNSVDSVTEATIAQRLKAARAGHTTIVITSSPVFHAIADRVITADSAVGVYR